MSEESIKSIRVEELLAETVIKRGQGYRLVQISATQLPEQVELTYSFDLTDRLENLRILLAESEHLPSISSIFGCAILYENEIHDLFGVQVDGLTVDFKGNFYKTTLKFPFSNAKWPNPADAPPCSMIPSLVPEEKK
jgi:ech hydrogenase subunit D